ncbi:MULTISPECIES: bifunctional 4-hydroxy-2-oxoglutarate aldolase/2-dehydro-3-deoxy-phosphogluconate aldolase [Paenibacillus]|uniref:2-dehydro-3-deoxyphosphogluconate aldolase/4-hydroxy-2-oxoglutarate aldolase n=2 Tax=Paenibacillus lactis TaxID=228574 RepID=G4HKM7_9BACL|nr:MULTISPECIES: bifunctional 4-hydroxy-2-oxoglutarate aldolase/2-dehydro-3-deoxy-phosphogluconate aldolase [Paenibacillus]EHB59567.1 2-dehydro-3-deoxyphosphogluconate aldolase/4-hydroxy-2-oxoglutarate aldolase [Paenibacillus lactis 154]MBP1896647.1 2-dehydro-3-deoxyphosphogluconate aldolase/(4S)-4-hydroxy-2-oxoglutarate aldolase [Paenibacillus lactis]MCM3496669.1 bifunctional 4-hydroxy-2-oxoglutarate aldolase/2-dehydro-3-deoxy-phosphogluconate aldolase [Paenibacillus lactis]GIO94666.1 ketohydr
MQLTDILKRDKLVAIVRGITKEQARTIGEGLTRGGVRLMEVTMNTEGALDMISDWRSRYDGTAYVGAGTVLDVDMAKEAVSAGAQFLISPNTDLAVIEYALERGIDIWPGAMTPTEIVAAYSAGAEIIKLFPMASLGLAYLKELQGPLSHIPLLATGGVTLDNLEDYFAAGAAAVGLGSALIPKDALLTQNVETVAERAQAFVDRLKQV